MDKHLIDELLDSIANEEDTTIDEESEELSDEEVREIMLDNEEDFPDEAPLLVLKDNTLFPSVVLPVTAGRKTARNLLKEYKEHTLQGYIGVVAQLDNREDIDRDNLFDTGCLARVIRVISMPDDTYMAVIQGIRKFRLGQLVQHEPYVTVKVDKVLDDDIVDMTSSRTTARLNALRKAQMEYIGLTNKHRENIHLDKGIKDPLMVINFVANHTEMPIDTKQRLLVANPLSSRYAQLMEFLENGIASNQLSSEISHKARRRIDQQQREYLLQQQMSVIQQELGGGPVEQDVHEFKARGSKKKWDPTTAEHFRKELEKLERMSPQQPDYMVQVTYLNLMLELPWGELTHDNLNTDHVRKILDADHFGLEKVKDRIVEHIAVLNLKDDLKSPILCLVGPPGTGKTSLGKSIARAMGRHYVRMALGGLHDEAEIRGHRRTYVGAMPGRIIQSLKKAGSMNPVFVLDEIDKVQTNSFNGDPTSALLEVLDPEQNNAFHDNYLDCDFDLSRVMFIATANDISHVQPALLDRMEIINLSGYILEEKLEIATRHLIPQQLQALGFSKGALRFNKKVLTSIINDYTRESGVRQLDKAIAKVIRRKAVEIAAGREIEKTIKQSELKDILGLPIHQSETRGKESVVGVATGLAWTAVGGEILFIESSISKGKGNLTMTGNLGDVMKESSTLAYEYIKANAEALHIDEATIENHDIHIHVPEGAVPKDGPSAGITMFVAMVSVLTQRKVRSNFAMTGEITLRGRVTAVGGIKEKILAAKRAGITDIMLSAENRRDIEDINSNYLTGLSFHYINEMKEALDIVLE